jgi:acetyl esterase/lipase
MNRRHLLATATAAAVVGTSPARAQNATPSAVSPLVAKDVVYGTVDDQPLLLDIASPGDRGTARPAVILLHGGGLVFGDRGFVSDKWAICADAGYVAVNVGYRLFNMDTGANAWPAQLDDVQLAVRWIRANADTYGIDPDRIGVLGESSGGQLGSFLGSRDTRNEGDPALAGISSRVNCVVDLAGPVDQSTPSEDEQIVATIAAILGGTAESPPDEAAYRDFSPITFIDEQSAPFLIMHGAADPLVPVEQSRSMVEALHEAGVEVVYAEFPGLDHFALFDWSLVGLETLAFLARHLEPDR